MTGPAAHNNTDLTIAWAIHGNNCAARLTFNTQHIGMCANHAFNHFCNDIFRRIYQLFCFHLFIHFLFSQVPNKVPMALNSLCFPSQITTRYGVERNSQDDNRSRDNALPVRRDAKQNDNVFNDCDNARAKNCADRATDTACCGDTTNDRGSNWSQNPAIANRRLGGAQTSTHQYARQSGNRPGNAKHQQTHTVNPDAEHTRTVTIITNRVHIATKWGFQHYESSNKESHKHNDEWHRNAKEITTPKILDIPWDSGDCHTSREYQISAAKNPGRTNGQNKRVKAQEGNEKAIEQTERQ